MTHAKFRDKNPKLQKPKLALGLDSSTQSLSAILIDIDKAEKHFEHALDYRTDERLNRFGLGEDYILPSPVEGQAEQPPLIYLASIDAMFADMQAADVPIEDIVVINTSGQQHGHVYLNRTAAQRLKILNQPESSQANLKELLTEIFAYPTAPIWMTSNTLQQTEQLRKAVGGKQRMVQLSGSDAPLRFTGTIMQRVAEQFPELYHQTANIQLISSFIPAILTANSLVPIDYGNACGMSLMNYRTKMWEPELLEATAHRLPGGTQEFRSKLPTLASPDAAVGTIATYYIQKYGFSPACTIIAGSGDNPQAKVPVAGDLLSLGTSFVNMVATDGNTLDPEGFANAMYDGIGRPFMFGCRTNGAMVWDAVRNRYGLAKEEYAPAEAALQDAPPGQFMTCWQPKNESFPLSGAFELRRTSQTRNPTLGEDYAGVIETSLASVYLYSQGFTKQNQAPLFVTGGATESPEIMRRVAGIWNRPAIPIEKGGAALGAAVAGANAYCKQNSLPLDIEIFSAAVLKRSEPIQPNPTDVQAYHTQGKYLHRFYQLYQKIIAENPI